MMSSRKLENIKTDDFVKRFVEIFGTSEASEISRKLDISYQAARNYLDGNRLPDSCVLVKIADKTPFSIHWLLTGRGPKHADNTMDSEEEVFFDKILDTVKHGCKLAIQESLTANVEIQQPKTIVLESAKVKSETARENIVFNKTKQK